MFWLCSWKMESLLEALQAGLICWAVCITTLMGQSALINWGVLTSRSFSRQTLHLRRGSLAVRSMVPYVVMR